MDELVTTLQDEEAKTGQHDDLVALCMSGDGYRAMLFHVGALWRLNQLGILKKLNLVSSVSGGSIIAAKLGLEWKNLVFQGDVAVNLDEKVFTPIRSLASSTVDVSAVIFGFVQPGMAANLVRKSYDCKLYRGAGIDSLPGVAQGPLFVINATNLQSCALWKFSRFEMGDYVVGKIAHPKIPLSFAVAASSAFPPMLSPVILRCQADEFLPQGKTAPTLADFRKRVLLGDGGIYDNLGLQPAERYGTVLVSDGGQKVKQQATLWTRWVPQAKRVFDIVDDQVRNQRKRHLIASFATGRRAGTYWGIRTDILDYKLPDAMTYSLGAALQLAATPTRLCKLAESRQQDLINWGYAVCDAAMRKHLPARCTPSFPSWPFP